MAGTTKKRVNAHRSRKGTNGKVITAKHNDRNFNVDKAEHINKELIGQNEYWYFIDLKKLIPDIEPQSTFDEYEQKVYELYFSRALAIRNEKAISQRHKDRVQTMEQFRTNAKSCPEETILTIGNRDNRVDKETLKQCYFEFVEWHRKEFPNVLLLDSALHADEDEASFHIHQRQVWFNKTVDKNGQEYLEVHQGKALESMGIERPEPDKKESRYNNAKVTYTAIVREKLLDIAEAHGIDVERTPQEKEKSGLPLWKLKANTLKKQIKDREDRIDFLDKQIEEEQERLTEKQQEKDSLQQQINDLRSELSDVNNQIWAKKQELSNVIIPPQRPVEMETLSYPQPPATKYQVYSKEEEREYKEQWEIYHSACKKIDKHNSKAEKHNKEVRIKQEEWDKQYGILQELQELKKDYEQRERSASEREKKAMKLQMELQSEKEKIPQIIEDKVAEKLERSREYAELQRTSEEYKKRYERFFGVPFDSNTGNDEQVKGVTNENQTIDEQRNNGTRSIKGQKDERD